MNRWLAIAAMVLAACTKDTECPTVENDCAADLGRPVEADDKCAELAYNGKDEDCTDGDWVDVDGDGVPAVTVSEYERNNPGKTWPEESGVKGVRDATAVDCNDFAANIHPGADEGLDDGVDSNCDGEDDLDKDGDGFEGRPVDECGDQVTPPCGDCVDDDPDDPEIEPNPRSAQIYPGAPGEVWYDGEDTNCDGTNDYDQDGDNYIPDHADVDTDGDGVPETIDVLSAYNAFKMYYGYNYLGVGTGDCLDVTPTGDVPDGLDAANVYPTANEVPYNGIDEDCGRDDDYDADHDGYQPDGYLSASAEYFTWWGYDLPAEFLTGDCLDTDATVHPDGLELLGDTLDSDCDGTAEGAYFDTRGFGWDDPGDIYVGKTVSRYAVTTIADYSDLGARKTSEGGVAFYFDIDDVLAEAESRPTPDIPQPWWPSGASGSGTYTLGTAYASTFDDDSVYMAISLRIQKTTTTYAGALAVRRAHDDTDTRELIVDNAAESAASSTVTDTMDDIDLRIDADGVVWTWACGDGTAGLATSEVVKDTLSEIGDDFASGTGVSADTAVVVPKGSGAATGFCCADGVCQSFDLTTDSSSATIGAQASSTKRYRPGHSDPEYHAYVAGPGKGAYIEDADGNTWNALDGHTLTDAAVAFAAPTFFVLGATDSGLVLGYGAEDALTEAEFPFADASGAYVPTNVGIFADNDRVILAATRSDGEAIDGGTSDPDDHVGWVFLGRAGF